MNEMDEEEQRSRLIQMTLEAFIPIPCFFIAVITDFSLLLFIIGICYTAGAVYHFRGNVYRRSHWLEKDECIVYGAGKLIVAVICFLIPIFQIMSEIYHFDK